MSESVIVFKSQMSNYLAISLQQEVIFRRDDGVDVSLLLDQYAQVDLYSAISLKQQSTCTNVSPRRQNILMPSVCVLSKEAINTHFNLCFDPTATGTHEASALTITSPVQILNVCLNLCIVIYMYLIVFTVTVRHLHIK